MLEKNQERGAENIQRRYSEGSRTDEGGIQFLKKVPELVKSERELGDAKEFSFSVSQCEL